jgi:L-seryl-tRNA(Ser) seleniumtransferase
MTGDQALRQLPSVGRVLRELETRGVIEQFSRKAATLCAREAVDAVRRRMRAGRIASPAEGIVIDEAEALLRTRFGTTLRRVINATGVILHTNLGRAPLSVTAQAAVAAVAEGYSTLEIDLTTGERGSRQAHVENLLAAATGAEAGFVVNNAALGVVLSLAALAGGRDVAVSRGELVEIGGSFRMPEVMLQSGARMVEIGTTNRTYLADYEAAVERGAAAILKVHRSNFTQRGFVHDVAVADLVALGRRRGVPVIFDIGSGCLVDLTVIGLPAEPTVQEAVAAGVDLVIFSADKLLGGPQAGIVAGLRPAVDRCRRHPLARAARIDKLGLAALVATLRAYLAPETVWREIPILEMLSRTPTQRRRQASRLARAVSQVLGPAASVEVVETEGEVGGGSLPGVAVPSFAVVIRPRDGRPDAWAHLLREGPVPVIAIVRHDALLLDVMALLPGDDRALPGLLRPLADA